MFTPIHESISVAGVFTANGFAPKKFQWKQTTYPIEEITLISNVKNGGIRKRLYSVMSKGNLYRLEFNRENETWILEEIWME